MLLLKTLKISLTALMLCAVSVLASGETARADIPHPDAYESLTAVPLSPGHAPRAVNGVHDLSGSEQHHKEKLPLQLDAAIKKVKKAKYSPSGLSRDNPTDF